MSEHSNHIAELDLDTGTIVCHDAFISIAILQGKHCQQIHDQASHHAGDTNNLQKLKRQTAKNREQDFCTIQAQQHCQNHRVDLGTPADQRTLLRIICQHVRSNVLALIVDRTAQNIKHIADCVRHHTHAREYKHNTQHRCSHHQVTDCQDRARCAKSLGVDLRHDHCTQRVCNSIKQFAGRCNGCSQCSCEAITALGNVCIHCKNDHEKVSDSRNHRIADDLPQFTACVIGIHIGGSTFLCTHFFDFLLILGISVSILQASAPPAFHRHCSKPVPETPPTMFVVKIMTYCHAKVYFRI